MEDKNSRKKGIEDGMTNPRQDADMTPGNEGSLQTGVQ